jgi:small acid-soluble spore protein F (minor alpha/beta-type SASP)
MTKIMSDRLKARLAQDLGVAHLVRNQGWGAVPSRECGRLVQLAVLHAQSQLAAGRPAPSLPR